MKSKKMENNTLLCIKHYALILAAFWFSPLSGELEGSAFAQTNMSEKTLQEVVVTGTTKSTQTIEEQGVSYTLLDSAFISKNNVHDLSDLAQYVPNLEIPQYGTRLTSSMYVRGIGSRINSPSVGVYYEGIPLLFKAGLNRNFYDISKMAVLRGPQGTLYGLNSEGGIIVVDGQNPLEAIKNGAPRYTGRAAFENHGGRTFQGGFLFPISKNAAASVQAFYHGSNGYQHNSFLNERADDIQEGGAKVRIAWNPTDRLHLSLLGDIQRVEQSGFGYGLASVTDGNVYGDSIASPSTNMTGKYKRTTADLGVNMVYNMGDWRLQSTTSFQYLNDDMKMDQDYTPRQLMHLTQHQRGKAITEELNLKGNITSKWLVSNGLYLAQQWLTAISPVYFDREFTNNLSNTIKMGMLTPMVQGMVAKQVAEAIAKATAGMPPEQAAIVAQQMQEQLVPTMTTQMMTAMSAATIVNTKMQNPGVYRTPMTNIGVFHESHYDFTKDLSVTLGLRYDFNRQELRFNTASITNVDINLMGTEMARTVTSEFNKKFSNTFHQLLPKLTLKYKDYYLSAAKGYRAGGYNFQMFSDILQGEFQQGLQKNIAALRQGDLTFEHDDKAYAEVEDRIGYDPEISWNFEVGGKNTISGASSLVNIRYAAFYSKVQDLQLSVMATEYGYGRMMKNVGNSTSCGAELNLDGVVSLSGKTYRSTLPSYFDTQLISPRLVWNASYAYTHTKFLEDKRVPYIPAHTANASIGYEWNRYSVQLNMTGRGKIYWDEENTLAQPFYTQFGARATADFGIVKASLWARNILNYRPSTFAFTSAAAGQTMVFAQKGEPFMMGINLDFKF